MSFAKNTVVPIGRTQDEIKRTLEKYKASGFIFGQNIDKAVVVFEMNNKRIKFQFPLAIYHKTKNKKGYVMCQSSVEKENKRLWRCLLLSIKSKLECIESGISTFEEEFLSHIVLLNGKTVGEFSIPQINQAVENKQMPQLLGF